MDFIERKERILKRLEENEESLTRALSESESLCHEINTLLNDETIDLKTREELFDELTFNISFLRLDNLVDVLGYLKEPLDEQGINNAIGLLMAKAMFNTNRILH